jgi:hypothetical protein
LEEVAVPARTLFPAAMIWLAALCSDSALIVNASIAPSLTQREICWEQPVEGVIG